MSLPADFFSASTGPVPKPAKRGARPNEPAPPPPAKRARAPSPPPADDLVGALRDFEQDVAAITSDGQRQAAAMSARIRQDLEEEDDRPDQERIDRLEQLRRKADAHRLHKQNRLSRRPPKPQSLSSSPAKEISLDPEDVWRRRAL